MRSCCFKHDWTWTSTAPPPFGWGSARLENVGRDVWKLCCSLSEFAYGHIAFWPQSSFLSFPHLIFYAAAESRLGKQNESFKQICTWIKVRVISLVQSTDQFEEKAICFFTFWVRTVCFFPFKCNKEGKKLIKWLELAGYNSYRIFKCA